MIITALTQNIGGWEKQVSWDYIHYFVGGITSFISYWLTQTSYDLDQAVEALVAVTLGHGKAAEKIVRNIFKVSQHHTIIKIPYLDQDADYVDQFGREFSGAELVHSGIHIPFAASDFQSYSLQFSRT
ncbi:GH36 C-terminal domain-containing protein [Streptococcus orisratti]|uniref:GH36 C-terminal domain-containing protein n=1 Tax=Streptococcus orisratti TaxID=114652 RepID=UPI0029438CC5|nr:GH36 C-terminal domain-containing protein [Streptococcus orisratti]